MNGEPHSQFSPRTAVITGAAAGIGAATAELFAQRGWSLVLIDTDPTVMHLARKLETPQVRVVAHASSVADEQTWAAVEASLESLPPLGALINNAYTVELLPLHELGIDSWQQQLDVNLTASYLALHRLLKNLRHTDGASVVFVSSVHAKAGLPGRSAYAATKGALVSLSQQLAVEYGSDVRFNTVLPGPIETAAWAEIDEEQRKISADATALGRLGRPHEVASVIHFLCTPDASFITGATLPVDGGWLVKKNSK